MAELFPDEGLDYLLGIVPKGGASPATLYLGLFTSQTASTVPGSSAVLATSTGVTEASGTAYARQALVGATAWGAVTAGTGGRKTSASQVTFPTVGSGGWGSINGFFLASALVNGIALFYANFDDTTAIVSGAGDIIRVTPTFQYNG